MAKYIYFEKKEKHIEIKNKKTKSLLGYIYYYNQWRQYIFTQADGGIIFSQDCLQDIVEYIKKLEEEK